MRPGGKEGFGYSVAFGPAITTGDLTKGEMYQVLTVGETTALPVKDSAIADGESLGPHDIFIAPSAITLATGDSVRLMTRTFLTFMKDDEDSNSKSKFEDSTQDDVKQGVKSFQESALSESTGSISGFYETESPEQEEIERRFRIIIKDDGTKITKLPVKTGIWNFLLSRRETAEAGEVEIWEYKPILVDQLTRKKPVEGTQEFSFTYTVDGKSHPRIYKRVVPAA